MLSSLKETQPQPIEKVALGRCVSSPVNKDTAKTSLFGSLGNRSSLSPTKINAIPSASSLNSHPFGRHNIFETDFTDHQLVAEGGFGKVFKCRSKIDNREYAIKVENFRFTPRAFFNPKEIQEKILREVHLLASLDHENVCRYYNTWVFGTLVSNKPQDSSSSDNASWEHSNSIASSESSDSDSESYGSLMSSTQDDNDDCGFIFEDSTTHEDTDENPISPWQATAVFPGSPHETKCPLKVSNLHAVCLQIDVYIQMALYEGNSLQHWLQGRQKIDMKTNFHIFRQIVAGLKYIHAQGLIHRDIKPANIFLTVTGLCVKIGDFGLATLSHQEAAASSAGVGTPLYSSPEQSRGDICSSATDLYSLGLVLCELFCQFDTEMEKHKILMRVRQGQVPPQVPQYVAKIIGQLVNEDPAQRPTCAEIEQMDDILPFMLSPTMLLRKRASLRRWGSTDESDADGGGQTARQFTAKTSVVDRLLALEAKSTDILQTLAPTEGVRALLDLAQQKQQLLKQWLDED